MTVLSGLSSRGSIVAAHVWFRFPRDTAAPMRAIVLAVITTATGTVGCAGEQLVVGVRDVRKQAETARANGALQCAPRELALADAHADFAAHELDQGDYFRAREHLQIAEDNAREALRRSPRAHCVATARLPRGDRDGDGINDAVDHCPTEAEDKDGFEDTDGCPDPDNDDDGLADAADKCPMDPEDKDGFEDGDGCPDPDNDKDGVADADDKCPRDPEDADGFEDGDGCPDPDNDKDGVADAEDKCPLDAGSPQDGGCPKPFEHIVVTQDRIELKQRIFFQTDKAVIMSRSYGLLSEIASVLRSRASMRLRIEGHTDARGAKKHNMTLSRDRAEAVRVHLVGLGVEGTRLEAVGFGSEQPIETNKTSAGRDRNRRVEFVITQQ